MRARWRAIWALIVVAGFAVVLSSCDAFSFLDYINEPDVGAPVPGGPIVISNVEYNYFDATWPAANDDWTPTRDLEYRVFGSQFYEIETLEDAEAYAEFSRGWSRDRTSLSAGDLDGALDGAPYYLNVFVRDGEGNTSAYGQMTIEMPPRYDIFVRGDSDVPRVFRNYSAYGGPVVYDTEQVVYLDNLSFPGPVAIDDISLNGLLDVVQGQTGGATKSYVNRGDWTTNGLVNLQELSSSYDSAESAVELGDFLGDGYPDLLVVRSAGSDAEVAQNVYGQFAATPVTQGDTDWDTAVFNVATTVAIADLDSDGLDDIVVGRDSDAVIIFRNIGDGVFRSGPSDGPDGVEFGGGETQKVIARAITDGDEIPDVLQIYTDSVRLEVGSGDGQTFEWHSGSDLAVSNARSGALADFDGDGDLDLALGRTESVEIVIYLNAGIGETATEGFWVEAPSAIDLPGVADTADIAAEDLDGDGDPDLVAVSEDDSVLMVWSNEGATVDSDVTFEAAYGFPVSVSPLAPTQIKVVPLVP